MWKMSVMSAVRGLRCNHVTLCGIEIQVNNCEIMCLNVYMPCSGVTLLNINGLGEEQQSKEVKIFYA